MKKLSIFAAVFACLSLPVAALAADNYTCYATDSDGYTYTASGYGSHDRIQQDALNVCKSQTVSHGCRRGGCEIGVLEE